MIYTELKGDNTSNEKTAERRKYATMISEVRNFTSRMMRSICFLCFKYIHNIFSLEKQTTYIFKKSNYTILVK